MFRDFSTFSCTCIFISSDSFSSLIFSLLLFFYSLTLPTSAFSSVPIVGSLTSKLPSMNVYKYIYNLFILYFIYIYVCVYHMCLYMPLWPSFTTHMCMWYFLHLYYYIHRLCILFCVYVCMSYFLTLYATFFMYICTYCNTCCNASTC